MSGCAQVTYSVWASLTGNTLLDSFTFLRSTFQILGILCIGSALAASAFFSAILKYDIHASFSPINRDYPELLICFEFTIIVNFGHYVPGLVVAEKISK